MSFLNPKNDLVVIKAFADNVHLCISFLKEITHVNPGRKFTVATVAQKFTARDLLDKEEETHMRYARTAMTFNGFLEEYERFLSLFGRRNHASLDILP